MKNLLLLFAAAAVVLPQPLAQAERDRSLSELHATRKMFLDAVAGLSNAQWNFKPAPERWSIAECAEHIALSEDLVWGVIQKAMQSPAEPAKKDEVKGKDEQVLRVIADRSVKYQAPEPIQPQQKLGAPQAVVAQFRQSRDRLLDYIRTTQDDLRSHFLSHPVAGTLDAYQWSLLTAAHTNRHVQQIQEVKAAAGYPAK